MRKLLSKGNLHIFEVQKEKFQNLLKKKKAPVFKFGVRRKHITILFQYWKGRAYAFNVMLIENLMYRFLSEEKERQLLNAVKLLPI